MRKFHTLKGGKEQSYNPKLTAARVALAKTESEIEMCIRDRAQTMRVTKEPEVRKQEILDTALKLFGENGYEKTSICLLYTSLLFYGDVTIPFVDRFPKGEIYNLLTTRPEDLKNEQGA